MVSLEECRAMPKVELHVHLEGSIRPETVLQLSKKNNIALPYDTLEGLKQWYQFRDFPHFVEVYVAVSKCIKTPEDIEFIAREFLVGQKEQNILHSEVTFTASTIKNHCGIPWDEQIDALERAIKFGQDELGVSMLLIIDIVRGDSPEAGLKVAEMAVSGIGRGVGALGLAGQEGPNQAMPYKEAYELAWAYGLPVIPHAGETQGADSIWEALNFTKCQRIGHGIRCLEDPVLVETLREKEVVLEVCPTSNVCLTPIKRIEVHPIKQLVDEGLQVTINSDDPPMFSTTLSDEFAKCSTAFGWDMDVLREFSVRAAENSLLSAEAKTKLIQNVQK
ncbi:MAG: adenosine deaminase [Fimbriimonadaceae bacterium]|nr:adenosine deaminase [Fimbriimonadaceae bacterium]